MSSTTSSSHPTDSNCLFCKIITGIIPSSKVYETDTILAFLDISPVNPGHTLVIPKGHYPNFHSCPVELVIDMYTAAHKLVPAIITGSGYNNYNLLMNNGSNSGQVVFHSHLHIIPRKDPEELGHWNHNAYTDRTAQNEMKDKIIAAIK